MGMNHMNGRIEDAVTGRMLSADPHVPDRTNAQSYNRYTYVNNNPLTATDPSGFCPSNTCNQDGGSGSSDFTGGVSASMYASTLSAGSYASYQGMGVQYNEENGLTGLGVTNSASNGTNTAGTGGSTAGEAAVLDAIKRAADNELGDLSLGTDIAALGLDLPSTSSDPSQAGQQGQPSSLSSSMFGALDNLGDATSALGALLDPLSDLDAFSLGKSVGGFISGMVPYTNAQLATIGSSWLPYIRFGSTVATYAGYGSAVASVGLSTYQGYQSGGATGSVQGFVTGTDNLAMDATFIAVGSVIGGPLGGLAGAGVAMYWNNSGGINSMCASASCNQAAITNSQVPPFETQFPH